MAVAPDMTSIQQKHMLVDCLKRLVDEIRHWLMVLLDKKVSVKQSTMNQTLPPLIERFIYTLGTTFSGGFALRGFFLFVSEAVTV
jgi:hypothetical protein